MGLEAELGDLRVAVEEDPADLVQQVLDGHADEAVEDLPDDSCYLVRIDRPCRVGVPPMHVAEDVEGPVDALGQGRVLVAKELGEGAAGELDQAELDDPGGQGSDAVTTDLELDDAVFIPPWAFE